VTKVPVHELDKKANNSHLPINIINRYIHNTSEFNQSINHLN